MAIIRIPNSVLNSSNDFKELKEILVNSRPWNWEKMRFGIEYLPFVFIEFEDGTIYIVIYKEDDDVDELYIYATSLPENVIDLNTRVYVLDVTYKVGVKRSHDRNINNNGLIQMVHQKSNETNVFGIITVGEDDFSDNISTIPDSNPDNASIYKEGKRLIHIENGWIDDDYNEF